MSVEERFRAAVNVIRGLPKNGSYQPSYDMMLRFYAYFKQGTEGTCTSRRPAFWDVVGKAKYDAWKRLGEMPKEKAMKSYVEELQKIVETMSYTDNVADFYSSIDQLDNVSLEDLQLVAPEAIKKSLSNPESPLHSRETSPSRIISNIPNGFQNNYNHNSTDTSEDDFEDTVEDEIPVVPIEHMSRKRDRKLNYAQHNGSVANKKSLPMTEVKLNIDPSLLTHLVQITEQMKVDLQQVNSRMNVLEIVKARKYPGWWPFEDISPTWFSFTVIWPVAVAILLRTMQQNKSNRGVGRRS